MKTINFLTSHFVPENTACTNRVLSMVQELEKKYKLNIICLSEKGTIQNPCKVAFSQYSTVYYVNQKDFNGKNFFRRAINEIKYIYFLIRMSNSLKHDLVIATSPYMFMIPLVGFLVSGKKILDVRDLVWEYLGESSVIQKMTKNILTSVMRSSLKRFNYVFVTNEYEFKTVSGKYGLSRVEILTNGIDYRRYEQLSSIEIVSKTNFTVTYIGNIGLAQNIKVLIEAAKKLPKVNFLIIGDGIEANSIKEYTKVMQIDNVKFTGKLDWNDLKKYYEQSSILYAQLDEKYVSAMPSKLYEYATIGLPIIYGGVGQAALFANVLENSVTIAPNDVNLLVDAINSLKEKRNTISMKNRNLIKNEYLREKSAVRIVKKVEKIIDLS